MGEFHIHMPTVYLFKGTWLEISNVVVAEWVIVALLIGIALVLNRTVVTSRRSRLRAGMEQLLDFLEGWYGSFIATWACCPPWATPVRSSLPRAGGVPLWAWLSS